MSNKPQQKQNKGQTVQKPQTMPTTTPDIALPEEERLMPGAIAIDALENLDPESATRPMRQAAVLAVQRQHGNQATQQVISRIAAAQAGVVQAQFEEEPSSTDEMAGPAEGKPIVHEAKEATLDEPETSEWDEKEGQLGSDVKPHVFINNGKSGTALDNMAGGQGGTGDQDVGSITLVAPAYEGEGGDAPKAWIRSGTGTAVVTRSYKGSRLGANGANVYLTQAAVDRTDEHEVLHVDSSREIHGNNIVPLERRVAEHTGRANARVGGTTQDESIRALQTYIDWNTAVEGFRVDDTAANRPMGTVDLADLMSPTFPENYGPRAVDGVNYATCSYTWSRPMHLRRLGNCYLCGWSLTMRHMNRWPWTGVY